MSTKGRKNKERQNKRISFGIISESEFTQGVIIIVIRNADQHNKLKNFTSVFFFKATVAPIHM
jgi:hypothetical protein